MRRVLKIIGGVLGVVGIVLIGGVVYVLNIDLNDWKPEIQDAVRDATGRILVINGPIEFDLGADTHLKATDIQLSNAQWGSRPQMVEVGTVEFGLKLFSLLGNSPDITLINVDKVRAIVETNAQDQSNIDFGGPPAAEEAHRGDGDLILPIIRDLRVADVEVVVKDGFAGTEQTFTLSELTLSGKSATDPLKLNLDATYDDLDLIMRGEIGSPGSMTDAGTPTPVDIVGNLAGIDLAINGQIQDLAGRRGIDIKITALGEDLADAAKTLAKIDMPDLGGFKADATLKGGGDTLSIAPLAVDIGSAETIELAVNGRIADVLTQEGIDLSVAVNSTQIANLSPIARQFAGRAVPALGPLDLEFKVAGDANGTMTLSDLALTLGGVETLRFEANGSVADLTTLSGADLGVKLVSPDLSVLSEAVGSDVPPIGPVNIVATIRGDRGKPITVNPLNAKIGDSDISGTLTLDETGAVPDITANLTSARFDVNDVVPPSESEGRGRGQVSGGGTADGGADDGRVIPNDPLPFDAMKGVNADIVYSADTFVAAVAEMTGLEIKIALQDGKLSITSLRAGVGAGTLDGVISLDGSRSAAPISVGLNANKMDLAALLAGSGARGKIAGPLDLMVDLTGAGDNPRAIASSLSGTVQLSLYDSRILKKAFEDATGKAVAGLLASEDGWIAIDCAVFDYDIKDGLAKTKAGYIASGPITVATQGTVDLGTERLDLGVKPAGGGLTSLPLKVSGTFASPSVIPDPTSVGIGILTGALTGGIGPALLAVVADLPEGHPCRQDVAKSRRQLKTHPASDGAAGGKPSGDPVEDAGRAIQERINGGLKRLFGD